MNKVSERIMADLVDFLYRNSINGRCQMSSQQIAERLRYSSSSVHRALRALATQGIVRLERHKNPTQPLVIVLETVPEDIITQGAEVVQNFARASQAILEYIRRLQHQLSQARADIQSSSEHKS